MPTIMRPSILVSLSEVSNRFLAAWKVPYTAQAAVSEATREDVCLAASCAALPTFLMPLEALAEVPLVPLNALFALLADELKLLSAEFVRAKDEFTLFSELIKL